MHLNELSVTNFRSFDRADFSFDSRLNLIVGSNGTGKSSVLLAIQKILRDPVARLGEGLIDLRPPITEDDVRFEMQTVGTRIRFERRYPVSLKALFNVEGKAAISVEVKNSPSDWRNNPDSSFEDAMSARGLKIDKQPATILPFFAFYGPGRNLKPEYPTLESAAVDQVSRRDGYKQWFDALVSTEDLQRWVIGKTLERLQIITEEGPDSPLLADDELNILNGVIDESVGGVKGIRFDLRLRMLMIELDGGKLVPFSSLSDGQRGFFCLIADICRRMLIINPQLGKSTLKETPGILLIDELDIHLHPDWQRRVLRTIRDRFPLLQIFATSHSPQMIGELSPRNVLVLRNGRPVHPEITFGLGADRVLEDILFVGSKEEEIAEEIRSIFADIENQDLKAAKDRILRLRERAPSLPEYVRAEALIRRMETIGR